MGIRDRLSGFGNSFVEELQIAAGAPDPKSIDRHMTSVQSKSVEEHVPDKSELEDYWELYEGVSFIRNPIRSFASEVVAPGYYIDTENEELAEELEEWLSQSAIVDCDINCDFRRLVKKAEIQREVKGTAIVEKVPDEEGGIYGFKLIAPEEIRALTLPGQSVLVPPDADFEDPDKGVYQNDEKYTTDDGEAAAYVQLTNTISRYSGRDRGYVPFTRDQIIKLTRDADTGDVFGTARLKAVEDRLESLLKKLRDNDKAIESTAHPYMLFQAGTEDSPWEPEKVEALANEHRQERYEPGLKQFVQGDISVEEYSGEVADVEPFLNWDLNAIMADMPMPKYSLGAFESDVNQFVSRSQSARLERQLEDARQEVQDEFNPAIQEKAEELGFPNANPELVIGEDPADFGMESEVPEDDVQGETPPNGNNSNEPNKGEAGANYSRPGASTEDRDGGSDLVDEDDS